MIDTSNFMAKPITDIKKLSENPHDMKTKMELLVMRIQVSFWNQTSSWYQILDVFTVEKFIGVPLSLVVCMQSFLSWIPSCWASFPRMNEVISLFRNNLTKWMYTSRNESSVSLYSWLIHKGRISKSRRKPMWWLCHHTSVITVFIPVGWILPCLRGWGEWRDKVSCWPLGTPGRRRRHYMRDSRWHNFWESRSEHFSSSGTPASCCSAIDESQVVILLLKFWFCPLRYSLFVYLCCFIQVTAIHHKHTVYYYVLYSWQHVLAFKAPHHGGYWYSENM